MANLQQRSGWFHLIFQFNGRQFSHALKTRDRWEVDAIRGTVDRVLIRVRNKQIPPSPPDVDVTAYMLAGGKVVDETRSTTPVLTLRDTRSIHPDARQRGVAGTFPGRALIYPKSDEKPGFQTRAKIERKIARGGLSKDDINDLWACLFLGKEELMECLALRKVEGSFRVLFLMVAFAAHTGMRRSELIRMRIDDVDLEAGSAVVRDRKRLRGLRSTRRVPVSGFLRSVIRDWLAVHPGGQHLFQGLRTMNS